MFNLKNYEKRIEEHSKGNCRTCRAIHTCTKRMKDETANKDYRENCEKLREEYIENYKITHIPHFKFFTKNWKTTKTQKEHQNYVKENWETLIKSITEKGEIIIIAENDQNDGYNTNKEAIGLNKDNELIWVYLSGCSCQGESVNKEINPKEFKAFYISNNQTVTDFYKTYKCEPNDGSYTDY